MNGFFKHAANFCHQIAIGLLILQLFKKRNARGISVKTQELRLLVFLTRYMDEFVSFYSYYNTTVKIFYIVSTAAIVISIKYMEPFRSVYNFEQDSFPHWKYCMAPSAILAIISTFYFDLPATSMRLFWFTYFFSLYLEAVAILPQLVCLRKYRLVENLTGKFVLFLGLYRFLYLIHWILTNRWSKTPLIRIAFSAGCVQTILYVNFFVEYARASGLCGSCSKRSADVSISLRRNHNNEHETSGLGRGDEEDQDRFVFELSSAKVGPNAFGRDIGKVQLEPLLPGEQQQRKPSDDLRRRTQDDSNV